jgi:hypothetical protein
MGGVNAEIPCLLPPATHGHVPVAVSNVRVSVYFLTLASSGALVAGKRVAANYRLALAGF